MQVKKAFMRAGVMYLPGGDLPPDLDKQTLAHYERHGMVGPAEGDQEVGPGETKPSNLSRRRGARPESIKPAGPSGQAADLAQSAEPPSGASLGAEASHPVQTSALSQQAGVPADGAVSIDGAEARVTEAQSQAGQ